VALTNPLRKALGVDRNRHDDAVRVYSRDYSIANYKKKDDIPAKKAQFEIDSGLKEKGCGLREMFHFRYHYRFPTNTAVARRVPCICASCLAQLEKEVEADKEPTTQPRFQKPASCYFEHVVEDLNGWNTFTVLLQTVHNKATGVWDEQPFMYESVDKVLQSGLTRRADDVEEQIKVGGFGAIGSDGTEKFFLIQFTGTPFLLQYVESQPVELAGSLAF
jgi:hypothetical protein